MRGCRCRSIKIGALSEYVVEAIGENENKEKGNGHSEEVGEPAGPTPERRDVCDVSRRVETGIDGAKGDYADDTEDDNDSSLYAYERKTFTKWRWTYINIGFRDGCADKEAGEQEVEHEGSGPKRRDVF